MTTNNQQNSLGEIQRSATNNQQTTLGEIQRSATNNQQTSFEETLHSATNNQQTMPDGGWRKKAEERLQTAAIEKNAELLELKAKLGQAIEEYECCELTPNQRGWRAVRDGERAFIVIAALAGGGFTFAMVVLPLPWFILLPLLLAIWLGLSWAFTFAIRAGVKVALGVKHDKPQGQERAATMFRIAFVVFMVAFFLNVASRLTAIPPAVFGITAVTLEISALICAACLGAIAHAKGYIVELVARIFALQHRINIIRWELKVLMARLKQFDGGQSANQELKMLN